jgi:hypothetical protein
MSVDSQPQATGEVSSRSSPAKVQMMRRLFISGLEADLRLLKIEIGRPRVKFAVHRLSRWYRIGWSI